MDSINCTNCGHPLNGKFCSACGQSAHTHRICLKTFISHDVIHGIFHLERGMLFTAKQALLRPGQAAIDYIAGKRKRYYNVFLLILIISGIMLFLRHYFDELSVFYGRQLAEEASNLTGANEKIDRLLTQKSKLIIFLFVPCAAINSYLLFGRKKLNLIEHSIIAGMILLGILLFSTAGILIFYLDLVVQFNDSIANAINYLIIGSITFYIGFAFNNAFSADYSLTGISLRVVLFYIMLFFEISVLLLLLIGFVTHWQYGEVTLKLF